MVKLFLAFLLLLTLRYGLFPYFYSALSASAYWFMAVVTAVGIVGSVLAHQLVHALAPTAPGSRWVKASRYLAPLALTLVLSALFISLAFLVETNGGSQPVVGIFFHLGAFNLTLFFFELLPALPLDGGLVVLSLFSKRGRPVWWVAEVLFGLGILACLIFFGASVYQYMQGRLFIALWLWVVGFALGKASFDAFDQMKPKKSKGNENVTPKPS